MNTNTSEKTNIQSLSPEQKFELIERINSATELDVLLDLFGQQIENLGLVDGYLINLRDSDAENLLSLKVHLTSEFHFLDETYYKYKIPLAGEDLNVSARAFHSRGIVQCDAGNGTEKEKQLLELWRLNEIAAIAILDDDDFSQLPIGTLLLLKQEGEISDQVFGVVEQLISLFYKPVRNALEYSFLKEHREMAEAAAAEQSRFLRFMVDMNNLTSVDKIYDMLATELFRHFSFDGVAFFLLQDDALQAGKVVSAQPRYQQLAGEWEKFLQAHPYKLDTTDGGVSHAFIRNTPLMFHDVQTIINLPMSEKDRETLNILKTPRTLLMVPSCYQGKPTGVIAFYSLDEPVNVSESDLHLVGTLSSFFGAAITNARKHAVADARTGA